MVTLEVKSLNAEVKTKESLSYIKGRYLSPEMFIGKEKPKTFLIPSLGIYERIEIIDIKTLIL
jgi:hypothetical protein